MLPDTRISKSCFLKPAALITVLLVISSPSLAQQPGSEFVQQFTFTAGQQHALPFWLSANQFGTIPSSKPSGNVRLSYTIPFENEGPFAYKLGADVIGRAANKSTVFFQQLYGEVTWGPFLLRAGRKEETAGEVHPTLSLGSMVLSRNAAPVTGISIFWPDFVTVPGTGTFLAVRGGIKHGWIEGYRIATNPWLHAKSFYIRMGGDSWPVHGYAGVLHYAMWGGKHRNDIYGKLPSSLSDYLRVFFFRGAAVDAPVQGESTNALGNSLGAYDFALIVETAKFNVRAYRQFYLEDTVSTRLRNVWDGMWGLGISFNRHPYFLEEILWEVVNTKTQSSKTDELPGTDNYYNHFVYSSGWTHRGRSLGTPAILTKAGQVGVFNNILLAHHFGFSGSVSPSTQYQLLFTYSRNRGVNSLFISPEFGFTMQDARFPETLDQYYAGLTLTHTVSEKSKVSLFTRLAYDWGEVLPDHNFGFTLGIQRKGGI